MNSGSCCAERLAAVYSVCERQVIPDSHPEFAALTGGPGETLVVFHKKDNGFDLVDVELIVRVEVHGSRHKRKTR